MKPAKFDYTASAELYPGKRSTRFRTVRYHRFNTTAEALRYLIEEMPPELLAGAVLETEDQRFEGDQLSALYQDQAYPLPRATANVPN
ncbi:hypothetical protein [Pelagibacterium luteolum]|uniref:Uncharacterized protein n=1 Tax=Pelagibacterium luteolum TaxID=440168 RepID=A0A1G7VR10_9HYPH|nr:hypothetical protein [Pelagibacterium luteolum]SDG61988.1 hypothetical protein SAMN04487974_104290 [Pelagibacterium luteolum]